MSTTADGWRKSTFSDNSGGNCVEVKLGDGGFELRDSENPEVVITGTGASFAAFVEGVKAGEFDA